jgi:hypothetical protein
MSEKREDLVEPWGIEPQTFSLRTRGLVGSVTYKNPIGKGQKCDLKLRNQCRNFAALLVLSLVKGILLQL